MSERGTELMTKARRQLDEMIEFVGALGEADLHKPCRDDDSRNTVGAVAAHAAEIYQYLGRFLAATGYIPGPSVTENSHGHGHVASESPPHLPELLDRLNGGKTAIGLLAGLTDEQLDSVPPAGSSRFSDGRRSLERVIDAVITHQAALLVMLKRAVALGDDHPRDTPHAHQHDSEKRVHSHTGHEHIEHAHNHDGDSHDEDEAVRSRHHPGLHHIRHVHIREHPQGFLAKTSTRILVTGEGAFAIAHVVLALLVGIALWQWVGGIVVGLLVVGVALYLDIRRRLVASGKEST